MGIGHDYDLAAVGGIGEYLVVSRHSGVENHLSGGWLGCAVFDKLFGCRGFVSKSFALKEAPVFEYEKTVVRQSYRSKVSRDLVASQGWPSKLRVYRVQCIIMNKKCNW